MASRTFSWRKSDSRAWRLRDSSTAVEQPGDALLDRLEGFRRQELPQPGKFLGPFAVVEPAVGFPLAP